MKKLSLVSVSILALSMGSQSLFAAEVEVPPSPERAAPAPAPAREEAAPPARERAAPARERAAPARERAAPRRAAQNNQSNRATSNSQASNTSWTGTQAGGFGGGNASAGGFADPVIHPCATTAVAGGFASLSPLAVPVYSSCSPGVPFSFSNNKGGFTGGGFIGQNVQIGNMVVGVEGDIAGKSGESSYVQPTTTTVAYGPTPSGGYFSGFSTPTATRTDLISGSIRQGTDGSIRPRIGYLVSPWTLVYLTGGIAFNHVSASYSYLSTVTYTNVFVPGYTSPQGAVDTLAGAGSVDKTLTGGTVGGGVEVAIAYGLKVRFEYRWSGFGGMSFDVPLARNCSGVGCATTPLPTASSNAHIDMGNISFHTFRAGIGFGL